jgi:cell division transport system permease protein
MTFAGKSGSKVGYERHVHSTSLRVLPESRESGGILPWVIAIMVFLLALVIAGSIALQSATANWRDGLAQTMTVRIDIADPPARQQQISAVTAALAAMPEIASARSLDDSELRSLLEPWLGKGSFEADLPIPGMIDITIRPDASVTAAALNDRLQSQFSGVMVDDHQQWLGQIRLIARSFQGVAAGILALVMAATMFVVALATRSSLDAHRSTIEILHLIGAEDALIAREFQRRFFVHGLKGGLIGAVAGAIVVGLFAWLSAGLNQDLGGSASLSWLVWPALAVLPVLIALITMVTARMTVRRALGAYL